MKTIEKVITCIVILSVTFIIIGIFLALEDIGKSFVLSGILIYIVGVISYTLYIIKN